MYFYLLDQRPFCFRKRMYSLNHSNSLVYNFRLDFYPPNYLLNFLILVQSFVYFSFYPFKIQFWPRLSLYRIYYNLRNKNKFRSEDMFWCFNYLLFYLLYLLNIFSERFYLYLDPYRYRMLLEFLFT